MIKTFSISKKDSYEYSAVPVYEDDYKIIFKTNSFSSEKELSLELLTGKKIEFNVVDEIELNQLREKVYIKEELSIIKKYSEKLNKIDFLEYEIVIVELINKILNYTIKNKGSDIHIEGIEDFVLFRVRIDGVLNIICKIHKKYQQNIISRIKVLSNLDYTVKNIPQDSRFTYTYENRSIDIRVATTPTVYGEKIVLRILDKSSIEYTKEGIGLFDENLNKINQLINQPSGLILCVGPTGCGKSSTIYTLLKEINSDKLNLITIEDPVEHKIEGINQININEKAGLNFDTGLQAILRLDPDKIMIGEIRNIDTANTAIRASITGRMIFSTLHTYDCPSTIYRLLDMGVKDYLISAGLIGVISQRLVRELCSCKKKVKAYVDIYKEELTYFEPVGCLECNNGYKKRYAVFEILTLNQKIKEGINNNLTLDEFKKLCIDSGLITLKESMKKELVSGKTSLEEVYKNIMTIGDI